MWLHCYLYMTMKLETWNNDATCEITQESVFCGTLSMKQAAVICDIVIWYLEVLKQSCFALLFLFSCYIFQILVITTHILFLLWDWLISLQHVTCGRFCERDYLYIRKVLFLICHVLLISVVNIKSTADLFLFLLFLVVLYHTFLFSV